MLAVLRFEAAADDEGFLDAAEAALALFAARPGFRAGHVGRAYDQPDLWCLVTEWESVGAYRRALGSYEIKAAATPLLSRALPEASAFEALVESSAGGQVRRVGSDRSIASR
jgi:heme-degrading monooxygenase HmoA